MNIPTQVLTYISSFFIATAPAPTYTEGVVGQPSSFLPNQASTQTDKTISRLIYRGLFKYDDSGALVPDLADNWKISDDGLVYSIKIKDNQYWSDGTKVNANDLIYTSFKTPDLAGIATDKVDDLTVRFTLPNKFSPFLSLLSLGIMQQNAEEKLSGLMPVSNGQFKVLRVEKSGPIVKQVELLNVSKTKSITKLTFRYYATDWELYTAARLGEIDGFMSSREFNLENFSQYKLPVQSIYYALFFNLRNEKLKDVELRKKLEKVLPINAIVSDIGIYVQGPISRSLYTDKNIQRDKYDPAFHDQISDLTLTLTVPDLPTQISVAEQVKIAWEEKLGIKVTINKIKPDKFNEQVIKPRDFEVLLYGQEVSRDPDRYINWHSTQKDPPGLNLSGFSQVRSDRALEEGRNETDSDGRVIHYNEFQKVTADQVPAIFLYHPYEKYYISQHIENVTFVNTFNVYDRFSDFKNWKRVDYL